MKLKRFRLSRMDSAIERRKVELDNILMEENQLRIEMAECDREPLLNLVEDYGERIRVLKTKAAIARKDIKNAQTNMNKYGYRCKPKKVQ